MSFVARNHPQQTSRRWPTDTDSVDDRGTTPELFALLHARFNFTVDVAAAAHNAKLPRFYDRSIDGLSQSWSAERVWCNPPYSRIRPWAEKAWAERRRIDADPAELVVMLLPANRTEQNWWQDLIEEPRLSCGTPHVEFLRGRRRFLRPGQQGIGAGERPPFGVCIVVWGIVPPLLSDADTARLWPSDAGDLFAP